MMNYVLTMMSFVIKMMNFAGDLSPAVCKDEP